ncbi:hypothetical protein AAG570_009653 [Ranatra chinensis]|uniref:Uncharacterized protein n=1 Tax=Ranatra chinensis TaxID=642074 RepID=A0ABD0YPQ0_9HEMI
MNTPPVDLHYPSRTSRLFYYLHLVGKTIRIFSYYPLSNEPETITKQLISGFKDFTKSGLSVGEKVSFWVYGKVASLSRKWITHYFLFFVIAAYSLLGGLAFHYIEGRAEKKHVADILNNRKDLLLQIRGRTYTVLQNFRDIGPLETQEDEEQWMGQSTKALREYEAVLKEYFKIDANILAKGDKPDWDYWSSVFYCGTIYTTIGEFHLYQ